MPHDGQDPTLHAAIVPENLLTLSGAALDPVRSLLDTAVSRVRDLVTEGGRASGG